VDGRTAEATLEDPMAAGIVVAGRTGECTAADRTAEDIVVDPTVEATAEDRTAEATVGTADIGNPAA
jgi:dihydrodipicolinate synthase/N-acetylneuraminate lyase